MSYNILYSVVLNVTDMFHGVYNKIYGILPQTGHTKPHSVYHSIHHDIYKR